WPITTPSSERAALAFAAAGNPAFGGQGMGRLCSKDLRGASLRGLEDLWIAADRILAHFVPEGCVDVGDQRIFRPMPREHVDQAELHLRLENVREPRSVEASARIDALAFEYEASVAAEGRNAEVGELVVLTGDQERVRRCAQEAERERFLF